MLVQFIASLIESFSVNFTMYVVFRVPLGICSGGKIKYLHVLVYTDISLLHNLSCRARAGVTQRSPPPGLCDSGPRDCAGCMHVHIPYRARLFPIPLLFVIFKAGGRNVRN